MENSVFFCSILSEKISFGGILRDGLFRTYGFMEGGFGVYGTDSKKLFETPLVYNFGGGGGTDVFYLGNKEASI